MHKSTRFPIAESRSRAWRIHCTAMRADSLSLFLRFLRHGRFRLWCCRCRQQRPSLGDSFLTVAVGQQTIVTDLHEALRQQMEAEPAQNGTRH